MVGRDPYLPSVLCCEGLTTARFLPAPAWAGGDAQCPVCCQRPAKRERAGNSHFGVCAMVFPIVNQQISLY